MINLFQKITLIIALLLIVIIGGIVLPEIIKLFCELTIKSAVYLESINI